MAIAYKSAGAGHAIETAAGNLVPACPATVDAGDILIAHVVVLDATSTPSTPGGWTPLFGPSNLGTGTPTGRAWCYGRIADGTEDGATVNFGAPGGTAGRLGRIYSFSGRVSGTITDLVPAASFAENSSETDPVIQAVTTTIAGAKAVALVSQDDNNSHAALGAVTGGTWAEPVTDYLDTAVGAQGAALQLQVGTPSPDPGTIGGGVVPANDDEANTICFEIRPEVPVTTVSDSATLNAIVKRNVTGSATLNAIVKREVSGDFDLDAYVAQVIADDFTLDAAVRATPTQSFTLNAVVAYPSAYDSFSRTVADAWDDANTGGPWVVQSGATLDVAGGSGSLKDTAVRLVALRRGEGRFRFRVSFTAIIGGMTVVITNGTWTITLQRSGGVWSLLDGTTTADINSRFSGFGAGVYVQVVVEQTDTELRAKAWPVTMAEPAGWDTTKSQSPVESYIQLEAAGFPTMNFDDVVAGDILSSSFTADAWIKGVVEQSFLLAAIVEGTGVQAFSIDGIIKASVAGGTSVDAVVLASHVAGVVLDAVVSRTEAASATVDAVVLASQAGSATVDAVVKAALTQQATADAVVKGSRSGAFIQDAIVRATGASELGLDAIVSKQLPGSVVLDAWVRATQASDATLDAWIRTSSTQGATLDAYVYVEGSTSGAFTLDAIARSPRSDSYALDGLVRVARSGTLTLDADVVEPASTQSSATADAVVLATRTGGFGLDAFVSVTGSNSITVDADVVGPQASFTVSAWVGQLGVTRPLSIDVSLGTIRMLAASPSLAHIGATPQEGTHLAATVTAVGLAASPTLSHIGSTRWLRYERSFSLSAEVA